jgi:hypothetical protein
MHTCRQGTRCWGDLLKHVELLTTGGYRRRACRGDCSALSAIGRSQVGVQSPRTVSRLLLCLRLPRLVRIKTGGAGTSRHVAALGIMPGAIKLQLD